MQAAFESCLHLVPKKGPHILMYRREPTPEERAKQEKLAAESAGRFANVAQQQEAAKQTRAEQKQTEQEFHERVQATREKYARGEQVFDPKTQPTPYTLNMEKRAQEQVERQAAEQARLAALKPFDVWFSTLPYQEQQRITKWQAANPGIQYPMPADFKIQLTGV